MTKEKDLEECFEDVMDTVKAVKAALEDKQQKYTFYIHRSFIRMVLEVMLDGVVVEIERVGLVHYKIVSSINPEKQFLSDQSPYTWTWEYKKR